MKEYTIPPAGLKRLKNMTLIRTLPIMFIAVAGGALIPYFNADDKQGYIDILPILIPLFAVVITYSIFRTRKRLSDLYGGYRLRITDDAIIREQPGTPTINLLFTAISSIRQSTDGSLAILSKDAANHIYVPVPVTDHDDLVARLQAIMPIEFKPSTVLAQLRLMLIGLGTIGLMTFFFVSTSKVVAGITGPLLVGLLIWSFFKLRSNNSIDDRTKRYLWFILLPTFAILARLVIILSGHNELLAQ